MRVADCSFLQFVYPFTFRPETFEARMEAIDANKGVWLPDKFPVGETLSHVADYLRPAEGKPQAARLWKLSEQNHNELRLTRDLAGSLAVDKREIPFTFGGAQKGSPVVELALFSVGVGFITVAARPRNRDVASWLAFLHYFRVMNGSHNVSMRLLPPPDVKRAFHFATDDPQGSNFSHILETLLKTASLPEDAKQWWYDVFVPGRMIPFAALFVDGIKDDIASEAERATLLYRVRNFFRADQTVIATQADLQIEGNSALMAYADGQQFTFSLEGGAFVAFDAPENEFFRVTLPSHLRDQYFLVFLLTLHQRFALMRLSQRVAERWGEGEEARNANFEHIREAFLDFSARAYFVQVMQREHHDRFYRKWHHVFQLEKLYQEVRDEVREMHEYLRMGQAERAQQFQVDAQKLQQAQNDLITRFAVAITLSGVVFGFLGIHIQHFNDSGLPPRLALLITGATVAAGLLLIVPALRHSWRLRRDREGPAPPLPPRPSLIARLRPPLHGPGAVAPTEAPHAQARRTTPSQAAAVLTDEPTVQVRAGRSEQP